MSCSGRNATRLVSHEIHLQVDCLPVVGEDLCIEGIVPHAPRACTAAVVREVCVNAQLQALGVQLVADVTHPAWELRAVLLDLTLGRPILLHRAGIDVDVPARRHMCGEPAPHKLDEWLAKADCLEHAHVAELGEASGHQRIGGVQDNLFVDRCAVKIPRAPPKSARAGRQQPQTAAP